MAIVSVWSKVRLATWRDFELIRDVHSIYNPFIACIVMSHVVCTRWRQRVATLLPGIWAQKEAKHIREGGEGLLRQTVSMRIASDWSKIRFISNVA